MVEKSGGKSSSGWDAPKGALRVEAGETVVLSPNSARFKAVYENVQPRTIAEVRAILGLSEESSKALAAAPQCCKKSAIPAALITPADLAHKEPAVAARAYHLAYAAAAEYVRAANVTHLEHWVPALDLFISIAKASLNIARFRSDIEIADGATLTISPNTHAVYASAIRIHGTGRIVCSGPVTFKITSLEGI